MTDGSRPLHLDFIHACCTLSAALALSTTNANAASVSPALSTDPLVVLQTDTSNAIKRISGEAGFAQLPAIEKANTLLNTGLLRQQQRDYEGALRLYEEGLQYLPSSSELLVARGNARLALKRPMEALADADHAIASNRGNVDAYELSGLAHEKLLEFALARDSYSRALSIDPTRARTLRARARTNLELKAYREAIADCDTALNLDDHSAWVYYYRALGHWELDENSAAISDFTSAIARDPTLTLAYYSRGVTYLRIENMNLAQQDFSTALRFWPHHAQTYLMRGRSEADNGQLDSAVQDFSTAIRENPGFADAWYWRAKARYRNQEYDKAIADDSVAINLNPKLASALIDRGNAYTAIKKYDEAIADYSMVHQLDTENFSAYTNRAIVYRKTSEYLKALADYTKALRIPSTPKRQAYAYSGRASVYESLGRMEKAVADLSKAIDLQPDDADLYRSRALDYEQLDDWPKAIADMTKEIDLSPDNATAYRIRGDDLVWIGADAQAFADYAQALKLRPNYAVAVQSLAQLHFFRAEFSESIKAFNEYERIKGDDNWYPYAVIWRHLAATRINVDDSKQLNEAARALTNHDWPYPIVEYILGHMDETTLLQHAKTGDETAVRNQTCEANVYIGERLLGHNETSAARPWLLKADNGCPKNFLERLMARRELSGLPTRPQ
ncbi:tetratricopeptide repeat protein [Burkholderia vietnamiensis]|uniref:tetratricopeptide repeat protein n=1 Tax=Burkholderia vietnamiensis TaxID=60552 RepID=UPI001CF1135D|nr:tetratricopeptide repeat protein [Burkholderia vietnamiensis]MCA7988252.1 tetratricopeptide repeat protein [Burkholderia vietnamiensis]HDR8934501.1 tetratricopeptide repeat protein [Burkholderia vietnamiensis]